MNKTQECRIIKGRTDALASEAAAQKEEDDPQPAPPPAPPQAVAVTGEKTGKVAKKMREVPFDLMLARMTMMNIFFCYYNNINRLQSMCINGGLPTTGSVYELALRLTKCILPLKPTGKKSAKAAGKQPANKKSAISKKRAPKRALSAKAVGKQPANNPEVRPRQVVILAPFNDKLI